MASTIEAGGVTLEVLRPGWYKRPDGVEVLAYEADDCGGFLVGLPAGDRLVQTLAKAARVS